MLGYNSWYELYQEFEEEDLKKDITLDKWQQRIMNHDGDQVLRCGRQVGKSEVISRKFSQLAMKYPLTQTLIIAASKRQAGLLFVKVDQKMSRFNRFVIKKHGDYIEKAEWSARQNEMQRRLHNQRWGIVNGTPTKTEIHIKKFENWGQKKGDKNWLEFESNEIYCIICVAAGKTGDYVRGLAIHFLGGDEAAYIPEQVWVAILPMLAVAAKMRGLGWQFLLSTPFGKGGHFYDCCFDDDFQVTHISSEDCPRISKEFLAKQRRKLNKAQYAQEWLGEFVDDFNQYFSTILLKRLMTFMDWHYSKDHELGTVYYLGIDPARFGEDEAAFVTGGMHEKTFKVIACEEKSIIRNKSLPCLRDHTLNLDKTFKYRRIFNDDTGVGGGLTDILQEKLGKSKVVAINNASKRIEDDKGERQKGILKEDLYSNALSMMEQSLEKIERGEKPTFEMINNLKLLRSLKGIQFEYTKDKNLRIYGKNSHLAEAFVRCCWANKNKGHRLFCL